MLKEGKEHLFDAETAQFFSAPILLDSNQFLPVLYNKKWKDLDQEIFLKLKDITKLESNEYYGNLERLKTSKELNE
jgi:hypothetical protein